MYGMAKLYRLTCAYLMGCGAGGTATRWTFCPSISSTLRPVPAPLCWCLSLWLSLADHPKFDWHWKQRVFNFIVAMKHCNVYARGPC